jgi:hypothetical protein
MSMKKYTRALVVGAGAVITLGLFTACSSGAKEEVPAASATTTTAAAMPESATFIADMPEPDGKTMTMAIAVEGDKVVAYATNGTNDEAYFFGTQKDGQMDLMSMYGDNLKGSFDGSKVDGEITMNEIDARPVKFAASSVTAPAGMYTATHGNARATWVVRPDHTMVGVMDNSAPGDHKVTDAQMAREQQFKDRVRAMRLDRQMQQAPQVRMDTMEADMDGAMVHVTRVTGSASF